MVDREPQGDPFAKLKNLCESTIQSTLDLEQSNPTQLTNKKTQLQALSSLFMKYNALCKGTITTLTELELEQKNIQSTSSSSSSSSSSFYSSIVPKNGKTSFKHTKRTGIHTLNERKTKSKPKTQPTKSKSKTNTKSTATPNPARKLVDDLNKAAAPASDQNNEQVEVEQQKLDPPQSVTPTPRRNPVRSTRNKTPIHNHDAVDFEPDASGSDTPIKVDKCYFCARQLQLNRAHSDLVEVTCFKGFTHKAHARCHQNKPMSEDECSLCTREEEKEKKEKEKKENEEREKRKNEEKENKERVEKEKEQDPNYVQGPGNLGESPPRLQKKKSKKQDDEEKARNLDKMFTDLKTIAVRVREHNARNGNDNDFSFDTLQSEFNAPIACDLLQDMKHIHAEEKKAMITASNSNCKNGINVSVFPYAFNAGKLVYSFMVQNNWNVRQAAEELNIKGLGISTAQRYVNFYRIIEEHKAYPLVYLLANPPSPHPPDDEKIKILKWSDFHTVYLCRSPKKEEKKRSRKKKSGATTNEPKPLPPIILHEALKALKSEDNDLYSLLQYTPPTSGRSRRRR